MENMENQPTRTGKRLEGLAVEDLEGEQASVMSKSKIANAAKEVWMRVRGFLAGKKVRRGDDPGSLVVCGGERGTDDGAGLVDLEVIGKELEDGVVVLLEETVDDDKSEVRSMGSESLNGGKNRFSSWVFAKTRYQHQEQSHRKYPMNRFRSVYY